MNGDSGTSTQAPQMRALLFTDLCDSLVLVERIGDAAAAELFQHHDRLVLALQQRWNGQLIDRSDGLFLLFERAIDALGFALDYQRGLLVLGEERKVVLRARAGLHVGEVLTWENSPDAVRVGAKSVEVEGLAKPMAARLMTLALPGQILLSAVAESLTQRATGDLGERGQQLLWKSHGRWRFKGVPTVQDVYEVGEIGFAPLRMPRSNAKARRDIPLWRQPIALAAEAALVVALGVVAWLMLRPEPAIAFAERDWVVLADVRNLTGNAVFDEGLDQALRISLEQSRHVNVLSDLKVRDTLARMRQPVGVSLDNALAIDVALRDGASAVIVPTVRETQGRVQVSLDVIDPASGERVFTERASGRGLGSVLASTDEVVASLRGRLGESMEGIRRDSRPLPEVTTQNLDALRAYALGLRAYSENRNREALEHFDQATRIDPDFAFAYVGSMRVHYARGEMAVADSFLERAVALKDHLSPRDALYLDAWSADFKGTRAQDAERRWKTLADLYPDYYGAHTNFAIARANQGNYAGALAAAQPLKSEKNPSRTLSLDFMGRMALADNDIDSALNYFTAASRSGEWPGSRLMAAAYLAKGDWEQGEDVLRRLQDSLPSRIERITLAAEKGRWAQARALAEGSRRECGGEPTLCDLFALISLNVRWSSGDAPTTSEWSDLVERGLLATTGVDREAKLFTGLAAAWLAQRAGRPDVAVRHMTALSHAVELLDDARCRQMLAILQANQLMAQGKPDAAWALLQPWEGENALIALHVTLQQIHTARGDIKRQRFHHEWLRKHRALAYADNAGSFVLQARNVLDVGPP